MENWWIFALGLFAQLLFASRMLVQWIRSERERKVVNPTVFWVISLIASLLFFLYGWLRNDFALMLGQVIGYFVYVWNLGAKGIWRRLGRWRYPVLVLLLAVPVAVLVHIAGNWPAVMQRSSTMKPSRAGCCCSAPSGRSSSRCVSSTRRCIPPDGVNRSCRPASGSSASAARPSSSFTVSSVTILSSSSRNAWASSRIHGI